jgi:hypothetical protein
VVTGKGQSTLPTEPALPPNWDVATSKVACSRATPGDCARVWPPRPLG